MKEINLFAGPGAGKSTTAAGLFNKMKLEKLEVELVTEFAKQLVWQRRHPELQDQMYVTANQNHRMNILKGQVDFCVTDSPLLLGLFYALDYFPGTFHPFLLELFGSYDNVNVFIRRVKDYNPNGRNQTEDEAREIDQAIINILQSYDIPFITVDGDVHAPHAIMDSLSAHGVI